MNWPLRDLLDARISQARAIIDAVMEAGHSPCSDLSAYEDALWAASELLDQALERLRDESEESCEGEALSIKTTRR